MTLQNVTVIIPAHNRPERLRRLLDYYSRTDIKVLVPDSSDHPFADAEKYPDITYLHRPKLHFLLKLKEVLPIHPMCFIALMMISLFPPALRR